MENNMITIIALAVDSRNLTLWRPNGTTMSIPQGDHRVARIVAEAKAKGLEPGKAVDVNIEMEVLKKTEFSDVEKGTNGLVRFFKIATSKLKEFLMDDSEPLPAPLVPDIAMGCKTPLEALTSKAVDTFVAVAESAKPTVVEEVNGNHLEKRNLLWITGFEKDHDRVGMIRLICEILHYSTKDAMVLANTEWPIAISGYITDDMVTEYTKRLKQIKGVHWDVTDPNVTPDAWVEPVKQEPTKQEKIAAASEKLKALGAVDTSSNDFHKEVTKDETVVAVVGDTVIPGAENLQRHMRQAAQLKDYKGFSRFLERAASVSKDRRHSVEDLMKFMKTAELPIADDGCILFLKRLKYKETDNNVRIFVDCHSGNIRQWVGCKIQVREDLVDQNRRQDCSHGLHVASMSYIRGFSGDVTIIGKVAPEDVFAVPEYSNNKMRVSAYHIIAELPMEERLNVNKGVYLSRTDVGKKILNDVLVGNHQSPTDLVTVNGHNGSKLVYTKLTTESVEQIRNLSSKEALNMEENLNTEHVKAEPVKAVDVKPSVEIKPAKAPTVKEQILELVKEFQSAKSPEDKLAAADLLVELRGKARKPWAAFGVDSSVVDAIAAVRGSQPKPEPVKVISKPKATRIKPSNSSNGNIIRGWLNDSGMSDYQKAHSIHDLKRAAKKSYAALGLTEEECKAIDKLKHHLK